MVFKKFNQCKIKFLNDKNLNNLTLERFTQLENEKKIKEKVKEKIEKNKIINEDDVTIVNKNKSDKKYPASFSWQNLPYPIISAITIRENNTGIININIFETNEECIGSIAINSGNIDGNWSISCPDNQQRIGVFKKKLGASGTLLIENGAIVGNGYDVYRNKVKFVSIMN